ncbi:LOW QUALITY PROTEIN: uncharacterized protein LOC117327630 [Pecten maximus]|uniref:LOW QUALITY PROTEIN: uncharacterized protein LOC117327630 n=1 Tax=Pecten maximus TaxID=6579 RepID=UPI0014584336|nr:LOW QUALITY PROTEIN: uncharacterized protein LOC117327630 [Pecten maximus]
MEITDFITPTPSVLNEDCDGSFLKRLSLYSTLRQEDLESVLRTSEVHESGRTDCNIPLKGIACPYRSLPSGQDKTPFCSDKDSIEEEAPSAENLTTGQSLTLIPEDIPVQYTVHGIHPHEFPVKGFYVDRRVCPGFRYKVRFVSRRDDVFDGKGRCLLSVGMGYGKRLTFKGDKLNVNDCFFWSDNDEDGYAFSHDVLEKGEKFILYDSNSQPIGDVVVESATECPQIEESMETTKTHIKKVVRVRFACVINYHTRFHGSLVEVNNQDIEIVEGLVDVIKQRREREAQVQCIRNVHLMRAGDCTLWKD